MLLRWLKKKFTKIEFISIIDNDRRTYAQKWDDKEYLKSVVLLKENQVFNSELFNALKESRKREEKAKTKEEWLGAHLATKTIQALFYLPLTAKHKLTVKEEFKKTNEA